MITLHHCLSARSFRPLWMLEELAIPYELRILPFPPRVKAPEYLEINPLGTVPALFDCSVRMTESAAICEYLATRYSLGQLHVGPNEDDFGAYLNYLHFGEATLTFPQTLVLRYRYLEPFERRQPQVVDDYARWFLARLRTLEPVLARQEYLCGGRFTAADVSVAYALLLARHLDLEARFTPAVRDYWVRMQQRTGYTSAMRAQWAAAQAQDASTIAAPDTRFE